MKRSGFSLVELSIVLVILGLLVGGILAGQSLIRASELRAVGAENSRWVTATQAFRDKYLALPGDMANATNFWGVSTTCSGAASNGTCNGSGDGTLGTAGSGLTSGENYQYWRQLMLAGLIEGTYSGIAGTNAGTDVAFSNVPASRLSGGVWGIHTMGNFAGVAGWYYAYNFVNYFTYGKAGPNYSDAPILKVEEAWNIDTKVDNGMPGSGKIMAINIGPCTLAASVTDYDAAYKLSNTAAAQCSLAFVNNF